MSRNMGTTDRVFRAFVVAPALVAGGFVTSGAVSVALFVLAAVMLATAAVGYCPLYAPFGVSTRRAEGTPRMR